MGLLDKVAEEMWLGMVQTLDTPLRNDGAVVSSHDGFILLSLARGPHTLWDTHAFRLRKTVKEDALSCQCVSLVGVVKMEDFMRGGEGSLREPLGLRDKLNASGFM